MTSSEECPGCGSTAHGLAGCPFEVPGAKAADHSGEVLGVLIGRYPARTMPIAMNEQDEASEQEEVEGD